MLKAFNRVFVGIVVVVCMLQFYFTIFSYQNGYQNEHSTDIKELIHLNSSLHMVKAEFDALSLIISQRYVGIATHDAISNENPHQMNANLIPTTANTLSTQVSIPVSVATIEQPPSTIPIAVPSPAPTALRRRRRAAIFTMDTFPSYEADSHRGKCFFVVCVYVGVMLIISIV